VSYRQIDDPDRLHAVIDAILTIEVDAQLNELLSAIVEQAVGLVGARYGALGVLTPAGDQLDAFITVGLDEHARQTIGSTPTGKGLLGHVIDHATPRRVEDISTDPDRAGFPPNHPVMSSFLGVPVRLEHGEVFGNLYLCDRLDGQPFSDDDEVLVDTLGRAAGLLIDKARMQLQLRDLALTEERERIARDLHDTVIQRLFAVGLSLQGSTRGEIPPALSVKLDRAIDDLDGTIREIRSTIFAISQSDGVEAPTMRKRVLDLCDDAAGQLGLDLSVSIEGPLEELVGTKAADSLLAALRETLSNVIRHAEASRAEVEVAVSSSALRLIVRDDGQGLPAEPRRAGRGLLNLSARAEALGGHCEIGHGPSGGTELTWTITEVADT